MKYLTGQHVAVGDKVIAQGMAGVIVCDFDNRQFALGYEGWDIPDVEMLGGGKLACGIMVNTIEAGLVYFADNDSGEIEPAEGVRN